MNSIKNVLILEFATLFYESKESVSHKRSRKDKEITNWKQLKRLSWENVLMINSTEIGLYCDTATTETIICLMKLNFMIHIKRIIFTLSLIESNDLQDLKCAGTLQNVNRRI